MGVSSPGAEEGREAAKGLLCIADTEETAGHRLGKIKRKRGPKEEKPGLGGGRGLVCEWGGWQRGRGGYWGSRGVPEPLRLMPWSLGRRTG